MCWFFFSSCWCLFYWTTTNNTRAHNRIVLNRVNIHPSSERTFKRLSALSSCHPATNLEFATNTDLQRLKLLPTASNTHSEPITQRIKWGYALSTPTSASHSIQLTLYSTWSLHFGSLFIIANTLLIRRTFSIKSTRAFIRTKLFVKVSPLFSTVFTYSVISFSSTSSILSPSTG